MKDVITKLVKNGANNMSTLSIILLVLGGVAIVGYLTASIVKMQIDTKKAYQQYVQDKTEYMNSIKQTHYTIESFQEWKKLDKERKRAYRKDKDVKHVTFDEKE